MQELETHIVTLELIFTTNFYSKKATRDFNEHTNIYYNIKGWRYESNLNKAKYDDFIDLWTTAEENLEDYLSNNLNWKDDGNDVTTMLLVPKRYIFKIDPTDGPEIKIKNSLNGNDIFNSPPFIIMQTLPYQEPVTYGWDIQGSIVKIHLIGFKNITLNIIQQPYSSLFPAPKIKEGNMSEYPTNPEAILKKKYIDKDRAGVTGQSTDYRCKEVKDLFDYIRSIDDVDINLEMLQEKFYNDAELTFPGQGDQQQKRLITKLFNKL